MIGSSSSSIIGNNTRTHTNFTRTSNFTSSSLAFPSYKSNGHHEGATTTTSFALIDLSPPGSPTFTTRSSSDGVSVDSFGSDGNSNPSAFTTSSGSTSQTESAFEDDFDFFGNLAAHGRKKQQSQAVDPWRVSSSQDPFGSLEPPSCKPIIQQWPTTATSSQQFPCTKEVGESNFFAFNDATTSTTGSSNASGSPFDSPGRHFQMPTIIWPKKTTTTKNVSGAKPSVYQSNNYSGAPKFAPAVGTFEEEKPSWSDDDDDETEPTGSSPPMPKLPPPPPPPLECTDDLGTGLQDTTEHSYGVALYDFPASQPGDLDLKEGDIVYLTKLINDNWMEGRVNNREGMFPINFVDVKIPLPGLETNVVNALYAFKAETSDDLSFEEGASIKVLSRISDDWLYGEYKGKRGQFPSSFVNKVPNDLPNHL
ncbi:abl interactor 1 isoform X2 [Copidosoma floridanum]|nr:abl interactor 1 isoform X2 [Copidosoma floridanum]XP_014219562.1 abl interactor 1 isoform X2 [Copidosoma floridanum]